MLSNAAAVAAAAVCYTCSNRPKVTENFLDLREALDPVSRMAGRLKPTQQS